MVGGNDPFEAATPYATTPASATNLVRQETSILDLLRNAALTDKDVLFHQGGTIGCKSLRLSYREILSQAQADASLLRSLSASPKGNIVLLHFDNHYENVRWFWAVVAAGRVPCVSAPFTKNLDQRQTQIKHLQGLLEDPIVLTNERMEAEFAGVDGLRLYRADELQGQNGVNGHASYPVPSPDETAALMLTSGSTGNSKAVCLSHTQIVNACRSKSKHSGTTASDTFLNWVGLDHVANLVEMHLHAMLIGASQVHAQADNLLADPLLFLELIHKHNVSVTFAPNFFLHLLQEKITAEDPLLQNPRKIDLASLKACFSGGEANVVQTAVDLTRTLTAYGVRGEFICPGYGLTESCAGLTWGFGCPSYDLKHGRELTSVGRATPGNCVRIMIADGKEAQTDEIGDLHLFGDAIFSRYLNNPKATQEAFTPDGWFITGDRGFIDAAGQLNLSGRAKELININGVKYLPSEIELALEHGNIKGLTPSFTAVFSHRPNGARTEEYIIVYKATYSSEDDELRAKTHDAINQIASTMTNSKPLKVIPLPHEAFHKSALGKLSRAKFRSAFEAGDFQAFQSENERRIHEYLVKNCEKPSTPAEKSVLEIVCEYLSIPEDEVSTTSNIFHLGFTSLDFFSFSQRLRSRLNVQGTLDLVDIIRDPTVKGIAKAVSLNGDADELYSPVVPLQIGGDKTPLWLVHPASGNVLAFVPLARAFHDRPIYGLRSTGVKPGERLFGSIHEMAETYAKAMQETQQTGPYAIAGYSLGSSIAFEIAKILEAQGEKVPFVGALDSPPHIAPLVGDLTWSAGLVMVSFFYELIPERYANEVIPRLWHKPPAEALDFILEHAEPERLTALQLDRQALSHVADVTSNFSHIAGKYAAAGSVENMDVFVVDPLMSVADSRETWLHKFLVDWKGFARGGVNFHQCEGSHADMLGQRYVQSFQKTLKSVLQQRGL